MTEEAASRVESRWVMWGYVLQCAGLLVPLLLILSLPYVLLVRGQVGQDWLATHLRWQLDTALVVAGAMLAMLALMVIDADLTDQGMAYAGDFIVPALALAVIVPLWVVYRIGRGILRYAKSMPPRSSAVGSL